MPQSLANLAVGTKVKFGKYSVNGEVAQDIIWSIVDKDYTTFKQWNNIPDYPKGSVTLNTERIIDLRAFDAQEPENTAHDAKYGNSYYPHSNIDQWLNKDSEAGKWYEPRHPLDQPPSTSASTGGYNTQYSQRPGFLNAFSHYEKNAILTTSISVRVSNYHNESSENEIIERKVFLPSLSEVGFNGGFNCWELYSYPDDGTTATIDRAPDGFLTIQAYNHSLCAGKPANTEKRWRYWTRDAERSRGYAVYECIGVNDTYYTVQDYTLAREGAIGVKPALNLPNTLIVSDTVDADGCYTFLWNTAPSVPPTITAPSNIFANKGNTITWGASTDIDNDSITYTLECSYNGGAFSTIYSGSARSYTHIPPYGYNTVAYRVKAIDNSYNEAESVYRTSSTYTIINNHAPTISGSDDDLGSKTEEFEIAYSIADSDGDSLTVTETIDGVEQGSHIVTGSGSFALSITGTVWLLLTNGRHTVTIRVSDKWGEQVVRTYTFIKNITVCTVQNQNPMESSSMPTRLALTVNRVVAGGAILKVEVCNNGFDSNPTWEDATDSVESSLVHLFTNTSKTADKWGVSIRVSIDRNGASGACYISSIGGNFE